MAEMLKAIQFKNLSQVMFI